MGATTRTLLIISAITLLLIPLANLFQPYSFTFPANTDIWQISPASYSNYLLRYSIIFSGLLLTVISLIVFFISVFSAKLTSAGKLANLSMFVFVYIIGWMAIPYWTNGLYHVFCNGTSSAFDPKALLPITLIGEVWRIPILILYPVLLAYLLFSLIRFIVVVIRQKKIGIYNLLILIFNLLVIASTFFTPHYFYWLLD